MNSSLRVKKYRKLMSFGSSSMNWLVAASNGSWMLDAERVLGPAPSMPASMIPGPAPVTTIQSRAATCGGEVARLLVERVVGLRAGRAEDRDLARGAVRREHVERVAHLLERGVGDLEVAAVGAVAPRGAAPTRRARRRGRRWPGRRPASTISATSASSAASPVR